MAARNVRKSQLITPFGVGSILDLPEDSLMLLGLDFWDTKHETRVFDDRLARRLRVKEFHEPLKGEEKIKGGRNDKDFGGVMPFARFPKWHFCPNGSCRKLVEVSASRPLTPRCDSDKHAEGKGPKLIPVRFVMACEKGHISDFPWGQWVHRVDTDNPRSCDGGNAHLRLYSTGGAGLAAIGVHCSVCGEKRTLADAGKPEALKPIGCSGARPWLGDLEMVSEDCEMVPILIQRGGSNAYFPNVVNSIKIPPYSERAAKVLRNNVRALESLPRVDGEVQDATLMGALQAIAATNHVPIDHLKKAYEDFVREDDEIPEGDDNELAFRKPEYDAFLEGDLGVTGDDLRVARQDPVQLGGALSQFIDSLVIIEKLVETRALCSFSRLTPVDRNSDNSCSLSFRRKSWLPAISGSGEGIFFTLNPGLLADWASQAQVLERVARIAGAADRSEIYARRSGAHIDPEFVLLHSLAHLINRRLAFDCGYGSSSIKERIYSGVVDDQRMMGILLYASESSSEGTLGGLVSMGTPSRFKEVLMQSINDAITCSNDPLCIESQGQGPGSCNLSACHGCALLPETSCEESNAFLDRGLIVGVPEVSGIGFFENLIEA